MRKLMMVMLPLVLAACNNQPAQEPEATETPTATPEPVALVSANGSPAGAYQVTTKDGTVSNTVLAADGTYTDTDAKGVVTAQGTWAVVDGKTCFTPTTAGVEAACYTETTPAADGSFTATPATGDPVTVRPAPTPAAAATPTAAAT
ncbi:hypothetical protein [Altererythrobacter sp. Root672]|uniref:hypothetical protein n=1 Tax=Altererythrobacter sp. Root672 TaxID=1736584 RepID=UPI0007020889|nr:hypothetical protein [Altererythrobacter sp. Root672]KRA80739.1 hypothetical protein ASD76_16525 [Altererythrobacter sp. Root672]